jgi:hypothetical protein
MRIWSRNMKFVLRKATKMINTKLTESIILVREVSAVDAVANIRDWTKKLGLTAEAGYASEAETGNLFWRIECEVASWLCDDSCRVA